MNQHRQATAQRVDFLVAVELHQLLLHRHAVFGVGVFFLQRVHFGLHRAHFRHGFVGFLVEREQDGFHNQGEHDNCPAPVADDAVQPVEQGKQRRGENVHAPVVFGQLKFGGDGFQDAGYLRASVEIGGEGFAAACGDFYRGGVYACAV